MYKTIHFSPITVTIIYREISPSTIHTIQHKRKYILLTNLTVIKLHACYYFLENVNKLSWICYDAVLQ